jgi:type IV pilus assembly protein PilX
MNMQLHPCQPGRQPSPRAQRGAILVVSLLLLLVLTILGVSSMQGTTLEESMAYATRDRNVALQSAEAALRAGEAYIETITSPSALTGSNGLYRRADTEPDYMNPATWSSTANHVAITPPTGSSSAQYFIKETGLIAGVAGAMNMSGYGDNTGSGDVTTIRVTARGTGGNANGAEVLLRSNYGRIY